MNTRSNMTILLLPEHPILNQQRIWPMGQTMIHLTFEKSPSLCQVCKQVEHQLQLQLKLPGLLLLSKLLRVSTCQDSTQQPVNSNQNYKVRKKKKRKKEKKKRKEGKLLYKGLHIQNVDAKYEFLKYHYSPVDMYMKRSKE